MKDVGLAALSFFPGLLESVIQGGVAVAALLLLLLLLPTHTRSILTTASLGRSVFVAKERMRHEYLDAAARASPGSTS
jgi:hypothetical protein